MTCGAGATPKSAPGMGLRRAIFSTATFSSSTVQPSALATLG